MTDRGPSYEHMRVCRKHLYPYDTVDRDGGIRQGCSCHVPADAKRWEFGDFNEIVFICACCISAAVPSGSRWSLFYCGECKDRIMAIRRSKVALAIPLGRHSMVNGIGLPGSDSQDDRKIRAFARDLQGMFGTIEAIFQWKGERLASIVADLDEDPPLADVFEEAKRRWTKEAAFAALCHWWVTPDADAVDPDAGSE
jgi:hypothetical protein